MNPFTIMEMKKGSFTKNDRLIYQTIIDDPELVPRYSILEFAKVCKVSQPGITRFCQKLGFDKYTDFKFELYKFSRLKSNIDVAQDNLKIPLINGYIKLLQDLSECLKSQQINEVVDYILNSRYIYLTGIQQSYLPAELLQTNLRKLGIYASAVDWNGLADLANVLHDDDLIIVFSVRAIQNGGALGRIYEELGTKTKRKIVLITMNENTKYKDQVDYLLTLPPAIRKDYAFRLESQVLFLIVVDIITSYIALKYQ